MLAVHEISKAMIMAIGFTAQIFFSLRTLFQWWKSEKAKKVVSPVRILGAQRNRFLPFLRLWNP